MVSGVHWSKGDAIIPDDDDIEPDGETESDDDDDDGDDGDDGKVFTPPQLVWGDLAPSLTSGYCADAHCSECRQSWYDDLPDDKEYRCKCDGIY